MIAWILQHAFELGLSIGVFLFFLWCGLLLEPPQFHGD